MPPTQPPYPPPAARPRARFAQLEPFAKAAPYGLLVVLASLVLRVVSPLASDLVAAFGALVAAVCGLVGLFRIYTSSGVYSGAYRAGLSLIAVMALAAVAVPNFLRAKARAKEQGQACAEIWPLVRSLADQSKAVKEKLAADPSRGLGLLYEHTQTLERWTKEAQTHPRAAQMERITEATAALARQYTALAAALRTEDTQGIAINQDAATAAEQRVSDAIVAMGAQCTGAPLAQAPQVPAASAQVPAPAPAEPTGPVEPAPPTKNEAPLWMQVTQEIKRGHQTALEALPNALKLANVVDSAELGQRKAIAVAFKRANQELTELTQNPDEVIRQRLSQRGVQASWIDASLGSIDEGTRRDWQGAAKEEALALRAKDAEMIGHLMTALDILGQQMGRWYVDGRGQVKLENAKAAAKFQRSLEAYQRLSRARAE